MPSLEDLILKELESTKTDLIKQYETLGLKASGQYADSLEVYMETKDNNIVAGIKAADYVEYMELGRRPNKRQDRGMIAFMYVKILEWMKVKGVTGINPWMAARKIVTEGITVPNKHNACGVLSGVINEDWMDRIQKSIIDYQNETIMTSVVASFKSETINV